MPLAIAYWLTLFWAHHSPKAKHAQTIVSAQRRRDAPESRTSHPIKELALALPRSQFVGKLLVPVNGRFIHRRVLPFTFPPIINVGLLCLDNSVVYIYLYVCVKHYFLYRTIFEKLSNQVLCYYSVGEFLWNLKKKAARRKILTRRYVRESSLRRAGVFKFISLVGK